MKTLITVVVLATSLVASSAFAGRDEIQIIQQDRANAARKLQPQGPGAAGATGDMRAARAGEPGSRQQLELLKRFHPKHAYGY